jgi:hypothetical protein
LIAKHEEFFDEAEDALARDLGVKIDLVAVDEDVGGGFFFDISGGVVSLSPREDRHDDTRDIGLF